MQNKNRKSKTTNSDCNGVWPNESSSKLMENKGSQKVKIGVFFNCTERD